MFGRPCSTEAAVEAVGRMYDSRSDDLLWLLEIASYMYGGARRNEEEPGGANRSQYIGASRSQEEPGGAGRSQGEPGGAKGNQEKTGGTNQEEPGSQRSPKVVPKQIPKNGSRPHNLKMTPEFGF